MEIWKDIKGFEGLYQISNLGRVKSISRFVVSKNRNRKIQEKILKPRTDKHGYTNVCLCKMGEKRTCRVHRLVAKTFINNEKSFKEINHIDGDKTNNTINNLEWCSSSYNKKHAFKIGLKKPHKYWVGKIGEEHPASKSVTMFDMNGDAIKEFCSLEDAARYLRINGNLKADSSKITMCCKQKRKTAYGYKWKYKKYKEVI